MMEKIIAVKVGVGKDKSESKLLTQGYDDNSMSDQLELLGVFANLQYIIQQRIVKLGGGRQQVSLEK